MIFPSLTVRENLHLTARSKKGLRPGDGTVPRVGEADRLAPGAPLGGEQWLCGPHIRCEAALHHDRRDVARSWLQWFSCAWSRSSGAYPPPCRGAVGRAIRSVGREAVTDAARGDCACYHGPATASALLADELLLTYLRPQRLQEAMRRSPSLAVTAIAVTHPLACGRGIAGSVRVPRPALMDMWCARTANRISPGSFVMLGRAASRGFILPHRIRLPAPARPWACVTGEGREVTYLCALV